MRLSGRVLVAEHVLSSETAAMKALLTPVVELEVKVLGTISDAQERELLALQQLWPEVPHQVCPFHVRRDASKTAFEADKATKTAIRTRFQPKAREVRTQIKKALETASSQEAEQLRVLDAYATGIVTALNTNGVQPLTCATVQASQMLEEIEASLQNVLQKGGS
jgi:hypothetical protein